MLYLQTSDLIVPAIIFAALLAVFWLSGVARKKLKQKHGRIVDAFFRYLHTPIEILLVLSGLYGAVASLQFRWSENPLFYQAYVIGVICVIAWLAMKFVSLISVILLQRFDVTKKDNVQARMMHTRIRVLRRLAGAVIMLVALACILMTFEEIRTVGVSLLASAGVMGIVVGLAAQKTIGNFFIGLQIAIAQPIRIDDLVVVEGESGRIEEIKLTYVIVKLWDQRRMIFPVSYFTEKPFESWTRKTSDLLGTVMLHVDYAMPVQAVRDELDRVLTGNALWDGKAKAVHVTDTTDKTIEIRILLSAADSSALFDLRCMVREAMIAFIHTRYPQCLPRSRA